MKTTLLALAAFLLTACGGGTPPPAGVSGSTAFTLPTGPGWTAVTRPEEIIHARFELMAHVEELMPPIDAITAGEKQEPEVLKQNAEVIGAMLGALPHLFPPNTNLFVPGIADPKTLALPAIWEDFDGFLALAESAEQAAARMAEAQTDETRIAASLALRATCDACHAKHLRPYTPPRVQESDRNFDFDAALPAP